MNLTIVGDVDAIIPIDEVVIERPQEGYRRYHHDEQEKEAKFPGLCSVLQQLLYHGFSSRMS